MDTVKNFDGIYRIFPVLKGSQFRESYSANILVCDSSYVTLDSVAFEHSESL